MAGSLACGPLERFEDFLAGLSRNAVMSLPWIFDFWAHPRHQLAPEGDWMTWVILGGRGAGKTRAGAEWIRIQVEGATPHDAGRCRRIALVGETLDQAREVMVFGDSGILACTPPDRRPQWQASRKRLVWPNGAEAAVFSASDPESLRGPQFDCAWCDELGKWKKIEEAWDMLQFALRLGEQPRAVVTTTPRIVPFLRGLLDKTSTVSTRAPTRANAANLSSRFLDKIAEEYDGTFLGRQEIEGELLESLPGALWSPLQFDDCRAQAPELDRIVVAVDPPVTGGARSDECGIIVAGVQHAADPRDRRAWILEDASIAGASPQKWAEASLDAAQRWKADRVVAEVNQGGDMVETILRQIEPAVSYRAVRASRGKVARAEPVAALYEQGRVQHAPHLDKLESQMCAVTRTGYSGKGSPDRVDALVWALTDLMIDVRSCNGAPAIRSL